MEKLSNTPSEEGEQRNLDFLGNERTIKVYEE